LKALKEHRSFWWGNPTQIGLHSTTQLSVPDVLSFLTYRRWKAEVEGLKNFPQNVSPDNIALLYYAYHIMVGLGTLMSAVMAISVLFLWRGRLYSTAALLWILMLSIPFPYIATTAGWMTAELGRQPWLIYGIMRTINGASPNVSAGNGLFSLLGFMGMYMVLGILFLFLLMTAASFFIQPHLLQQFRTEPWGVVFPILAVVGMVAARVLSPSRRDLQARYMTATWGANCTAFHQAPHFPCDIPRSGIGMFPR
jgi:cytochrome bd-type quinol oxidase subunit 1